MRAHHVVAEGPVNLACDHGADGRRLARILGQLVPDDAIALAHPANRQTPPLEVQLATVGHLAPATRIERGLIERHRAAIRRHHAGLEGAHDSYRSRRATSLEIAHPSLIPRLPGPGQHLHRRDDWNTR